MMAIWHHIQRSFAGGEISPKMLMRQDHEYYKQSTLGMVNFLPTPQGSAVRAPGLRYLEEITPPTLTGDWTYAGQTTGNASAGEWVFDATGQPDIIRISETDNSATGRGNMLGALVKGDLLVIDTWTFRVVDRSTYDSGPAQYIVPVRILSGSEPALGLTTLTYTPKTVARIIPYLSSANERNLLVFTPTRVRMLLNVTDRVTDETVGIPADPGTGTVIYRQQIVENAEFNQSIEPWDVEPNEYTGENGDGPLGVYEAPGAMAMVPRLYKWPAKEAAIVTAEHTASVDFDTDVITLDYEVFYNDNFPTGSGGFEFKLEVSANSDYSSPLYTETFTNVEHPVAGGTFNPGTVNVSLPTTAWTGTLYIRLTAEAKEIPSGDRKQEYSNPRFDVRWFRIWANAETELTDAILTAPYSSDDLPDLHYIQSPYDPKELVITHPRHQPHRFYFDTGSGQYRFQPIPFSNQPSQWSVNNYPASCTSYAGRLVLGGSQSFKVTTGDPVASVSETVWGTKVGDWTAFSTTAGINPDDSIEFTSIYRSPIQWVYGQKTLLVGALEFEYNAIADGILAPSDLGVFMQSTHGSSNVQPVGFGEAVLFPADGGTKVRSMTYNNDDQTYVSVDLTLYHPEILHPGIVRMQRVRTPHQMCWVLTERGMISIFHSESGLEGWSRYRTAGGKIKDLAVMANEDGYDVPFVTVQRTVNGVKRLNLEAVPGMGPDRTRYYADSHLVFNFQTETDTITGLEHLEGKIVTVSTQYRLIGYYRVTGGQVVLTDDTGGTTPTNNAMVGMQFRSVIYTLPPEKLDPGANVRYLDFGVRVIGSTRPILNGERVKDRSVTQQLGRSQALDLIADWEVPVRGWNPYQSIAIEEILPFNCEVIGVYGKLESNSP